MVVVFNQISFEESNQLNQSVCQTMSAPKPLGVFWDTNELSIPSTMTTNESTKHLRKFISNKFNNNCIEYQFCCFYDNLRDISFTQSLIENGCEVHEIDSNSEMNVFIEMDQIIRRFVEIHGFDTIVVIVSNNCYLSSTIRLIRNREVSVLLISSQKPTETAGDWIAFDDVFELNSSVILSITDIPKEKSRKVIRESFIPFCRQFKCKFRFSRRESVKLEFNNPMDAERAHFRLNELQFFGHDLNVEIVSNEDKPNDFYSSSVGSSDSSLVSSPTKELVLPQNDDKCKSVIIGLFTKFNQNVHKFVRNLIKEWNDPSVSEFMIFRVNREKDFIGRDGKASLIVTAIDRESNQKLMTAAKKHFVDRKNKHYWNRLQRSQKDTKQTNCKTLVVNSRNRREYPNGSPSNQSLHSNSSLKSNDECLPYKTETISSYASIASKPIIIENVYNSSFTSNEIFMNLLVPQRLERNKSSHFP